MTGLLWQVHPIWDLDQGDWKPYQVLILGMLDEQITIREEVAGMTKQVIIMTSNAKCLLHAWHCSKHVTLIHLLLPPPCETDTIITLISTDEDTKAQRLTNLPKVTALEVA